MKNQRTPVSALLFMTSECPNCPAVLQALGELVKEGHLGKLTITNLSVNPEAATEFNIRSVPFVRIGLFDLTGLRSKKELYGWVRRAGSITGMANYFAELLTSGQLNEAIAFTEKHPKSIEALFVLASTPETGINTRIGISAIIEAMADKGTLSEHIDGLLTLSKHDDPQVRSEACHFLALSQSAEAKERLETLLSDSEENVRLAAKESLDDMIHG